MDGCQFGQCGLQGFLGVFMAGDISKQDGYSIGSRTIHRRTVMHAACNAEPFKMRRFPCDGDTFKTLHPVGIDFRQRFEHRSPNSILRLHARQSSESGIYFEKSVIARLAAGVTENFKQDKTGIHRLERHPETLLDILPRRLGSFGGLPLVFETLPQPDHFCFHPRKARTE